MKILPVNNYQTQNQNSKRQNALGFNGKLNIHYDEFDPNIKQTVSKIVTDFIELTGFKGGFSKPAPSKTDTFLVCPAEFDDAVETFCNERQQVLNQTMNSIKLIFKKDEKPIK